MMKNKIIILTAIILLASFSIKAQEDGKIIDKVIAVVGSNVILKSDLESQIVSLRAQGVLIDDNARCELLEELSFQKLLLHQALIDSVTVTEAEVESEIDRRMNYFIAQIGSEKKLEQYYKKSILEIKEEFRVIVREQMISQRMQGRITSGAQVTPKEVKAYFEGLNADSIPLIESEVEYAQILINASESAEAKQTAKDRINAFRERIVNGEDFSTLAILYSEDEGSAKNGGEIGFMGRAELVPEFSILAFKLKNTAVSEVIETEFGYHIMELIQRRGLKVNVRHILVKVKIGEKQIEEAKNLADSIYNILQTDTFTFEELAEKYSHDDQTKKSRGLVVNSQTGTSIFDIDQVNPQVFYSIDKMKVGEVSTPVPAQGRDGKKGYRIIKLITKTEPHKASIDSDYSKIQNAALASIQNQETVKWIKGKVSQTYIKIDEEYRGCKFDNSWVK
ncbi:MAG: peptidylprolyl isomerase [Flavobacteriales bacterium]|nr:peptidylprolyl isomerase [Flavobacteriales bacterium]